MVVGWHGMGLDNTKSERRTATTGYHRGYRGPERATEGHTLTEISKTGNGKEGLAYVGM